MLVDSLLDETIISVYTQNQSLWYPIKQKIKLLSDIKDQFHGIIYHQKCEIVIIYIHPKKKKKKKKKKKSYKPKKCHCRLCKDYVIVVV